MGDSATREDQGYGAMATEQAVMNGVNPGMRTHLPSVQQESSAMENPSAGDVALQEDRPGVRRVPEQSLSLPQPTTAEPPYEGLPQPGANVITTEPSRAPMGSQESVTPTSSAMRVQEFYTSHTGEAGEGQGVRWMARFTEFLRMTATRSANGVVRVLDGLGIPSVNYQREPRTVGSTMANVPMNFSPPEALPSPATQLPAVPGSWATPPAIEGPLFGPTELARMQQAQQEYPLIYGRPQGQGSEGDSERSSRLQAEVQRQLEDYKVKQQQEVERLQKEINQLRVEREEERRRNNAMGMSAQSQGLQPQSHGVPEGNQGPVPQPPPVPLEANLSRVAPSPIPPPPRIPQGALGPHREGSLPNGQVGVTSSAITAPLPSVPARSVNGQPLPQPPKAAVYDVHHYHQDHQPQGLAVPEGVPGLHSHGCGVSVGDQGLQHQSHGVPGGNQETQPPGLYFSAQAGGLPGPKLNNAQAGGLPGLSAHTAQAGGLPGSSSSAQQWLGQQNQDGAIAMLADGMAQLQKAMIKQIDKGDTEDKSPETVKPGTLALPMLKEVVAETSCVDVMDWMELIDGPMSDLSDSSAGWWRRVTSEAYRAYGLWSLASPLDRLAIYPEVKDLEEGKFSRLNSMAAAMILTALHETVRQEVVARRLTGSTVRLVFRLLTLYQPGGEEEKFKILQNLQSPAPEQEASKAVLALRAWSRWLRRCKELNVQTPDPSLLARGLTNLVKSVMEKNADSAFRTSLVTSTLQIDSNPSYDKVDSYFKHLMAECEAMAVSASGVQTVTVTPRRDPRLRPMKPEPKTSPTPPNPKTTSTATTYRANFL